MPLFGKKKKDENDDLEAEEVDDGLLMSTNLDQSDSPAKQTPDAGPSEPADDLAAAAAEEQPDDEEEVDPLLAAASEDAAAESAPAAPAEATKNDESGVDDLMAAFQTDESSDGELATLLEGIEDVPASTLLAELREFRASLPPEALGQGETTT